MRSIRVDRARRGRVARRDSRYPALMLSLLLQAALSSPLPPEDERASLRLPPGFTVELVVAEPDAQKIVDVAFDDAGRMWAITAREYPLDGNEDSRAAELYARGGRDQVLVFDTPWAEGPQTPRVFADGLAMPMAILPSRSGALIGHGPEILFLDDGDGDGRADRREVVLSGFGIQDSHLLPHRFVRAPGGWILTAQGAFNSSRVRTRGGEIVPFDQCKLARFQPDGSAFEVIGYGLNNIWGIVLDRAGEVWIQEANDLGYPVVPFFAHASYPGIGDHKHRPYSPWQPALARFQMGGTGLSGLARAEDRDGFPEPWRGRFFVANPITNAVQTIALSRDGDLDRLELVEPLIETADTWFRPVAIHFGPDGCLYVVDWYNAIISHNEVPRSDPRRDKERTRVWRVRHESMARRAPVDLTRVPTSELVEHLDSASTWQARAAWHQIVDRGARELAPELRRELLDVLAPLEARILALWSLEGLGSLDVATLEELASVDSLPDGHSWPPSLRREAVRASGALDDAGLAVRLAALGASADLALTIQVTQTLSEIWRRGRDAGCLDLLLGCAPPPAQASPYDEFRRSLVRAAFEDAQPGRWRHLVERDGARAPDGRDEGRVLYALALGGPDGAQLLASLLVRLGREPAAEELALLAAHLDVAEARALLEVWLADSARRERVIDELLARGPGAGPGALGELVARALETVGDASSEAAKDRAIRAAGAWRLQRLAPALERLASDSAEPVGRRAKALAALIELGRQGPELCAELARVALPGEELQRTAILGLATLGTDDAAAALFESWRALAPVLKRDALRTLARNEAGAKALLAALERGDVGARDLEPALVERLRAVGAGSEALAALDAELAARAESVLVCSGGGDDGLDTDLELAPPFTLEAWVALAEPITNADGILGRANSADFNFADARFRFYAGPSLGDRVIARRRIEAEAWTHVAVTCDAEGRVALYQNGEAESEGSLAPDARFERLDVARTTPAEGTRGRIAQWRLWNRARSAAELGRDFRLRADALSSRDGLVRSFSSAADFAPLAGSARVERTLDGPPLLDAETARALEARFDRARALAARGGDAALGRGVFERTCLVCHSVAKLGAAIGPPLDGSAHRGTEALLRAIVTPSAAVEGGYRLLLVETLEGEHLDGLLARQDERSIVLRRQGREDLVLAREGLASLAFDRLSVMPDGLLDGLSDDEVAALFAYLAGLR